MKQMTTMTDQMIGSDLSPEKKAKMAAFQARVLQAIEEQVGWKAMEPALVTLYAQTYTEDELDASSSSTSHRQDVPCSKRCLNSQLKACN